MQESVVIVAGGSGSRMNSELPKQFIEINGDPILFYTIRKFYAYNKNIKIVVVLPQDQEDYWRSVCNKKSFAIKHMLTAGGATRFFSVQNGLNLVGNAGIVGIHDGVRPCVSVDTIKRCYSEAKLKGNALPVIDLVDSIRYVSEGISKSVNRKEFKLVQTPQVFKASELLAAYEQDCNDSFTDDAGVMEAAGYDINVVEGNPENIKITTPSDLEIAKIFLRK